MQKISQRVNYTPVPLPIPCGSCLQIKDSSKLTRYGHMEICSECQELYDERDEKEFYRIQEIETKKEINDEC